MENFTITAVEAGERLDRILKARLPAYSRARLIKAIKEGCCRVDGLVVHHADMKMRAGQDITLELSSEECSITPEAKELEVIWHDTSLTLVNKPPGLTVHPCPSCPEGTLVHRLLAHFPDLKQQEGLRPGIVHRLDKDTSGLLLVALTEETRLRLSAFFAERQVYKEYLALVHGVPSKEGACREPIGRHPTRKILMSILPENRGGKAAHTTWRRLWKSPDGRFSLLAVRIFTGRTHQIRVHMAHLGHPLLGDLLYKPATYTDVAQRQMLHAWQIAFPHPHTQEKLSFSCPPPNDMLQTILAMTQRMQRIVITGNPGCGKSSFAKLLHEHGLPLFDADAHVRMYYAPDGHGWNFLHSHYGMRFFAADNNVNRPLLLAAMREDPALRRHIEEYIHTLVRHDLAAFWEKQERDGHRKAVAEIPLFFEAGWNQPISKQPPSSPPPSLQEKTPQELVVAVHCPLQERHARLHATRGWSAADAATIESWQWSAERKEKAASFVIDNSGSESALAEQVTLFLKQIDLHEKEKEQALRKHIESLWHDTGVSSKT